MKWKSLNLKAKKKKKSETQKSRFEWGIKKIRSEFEKKCENVSNEN